MKVSMKSMVKPFSFSSLFLSLWFIFCTNQQADPTLTPERVTTTQAEECGFFPVVLGPAREVAMTGMIPAALILEAAILMEEEPAEIGNLSYIPQTPP
jgi:hypothetical protein